MAEKGLRYKDKVVIVTGGCSGIGKGCVDVFNDHIMAEKGLRYKDKVVIVTGGCSGIGKGCVDVFNDHIMAEKGLRYKDKVVIVTGGCSGIGKGCVDVFNDHIMAEKGLRYKDKVVIVTGGCSGIGKGCVDVFTDQGGKVAVFDINDKEGENLAGKSGHGEILYIHCDTTVEEDVKTAMKTTAETFGQIDCLINNAGVLTPALKIDEFTADDFRQVLEVNLIGYFLCCKYALPYLRQTKGNIVNIASVVQCGQPNSSIYGATKGGVSALARGLAVDEAKYGVRINSVSPGATDTPMFRQFFNPSDDMEKINNRVALGRICQPKEIGSVCLFLATDATYCTAIDIFATGGSEIGGWK